MVVYRTGNAFSTSGCFKNLVDAQYVGCALGERRTYGRITGTYSPSSYSVECITSTTQASIH